MDVMTIQGTEIQIKEYCGKRVVTFRDIDAVHQRSEGTAKRNFNQNRQRFISGVDFYKVDRKEVGTNFVQTYGFNDCAPSGFLITESGYLMLVKSFTDDLAWRVQRELVDSYFRVRADINLRDGTVETSEPISVINTDKLIKCAEIMAGCLEGNRPYVLNILKNIIPDVEKQEVLVVPVQVESGEIKEVPDTSEKTVVKRSPIKQCVPIDIPKMLSEMNSLNMTVKQLAEKAMVSPSTIGSWIAGIHEPVLQNRINVCVALGKDEDFLTPKRTRRKQN